MSGHQHIEDYRATGCGLRLVEFPYAFHLDLLYPSYTRPTYVHLNQENVRASDGIRIHYDYERDGWVIEQPSVHRWEVDDKVCDEGWTEVAFAQSWALQKEDHE